MVNTATIYLNFAGLAQDTRIRLTATVVATLACQKAAILTLLLPSLFCFYFFSFSSTFTS